MIKLHVEGMSCGGCARRITQAVGKVDANAQVHVDLDTKEVTITGHAAPEAYAAAIRQAGFTPRADG